MDSINKEQPEKNHENLFGKDASEKIKEIVKKSPTCMFCTDVQPGRPFATRPMAIQKLDDNGVLWFLSASDSHKNAQLKIDPHCQLLFQGSTYFEFMTLFGTATITTDRAKIDELWEPILKDWFTEGKTDPRITVIAVRPTDGYYWDTKHGKVVAMVKRVVGAVAGRTLDDSIEGTLKT